MAISAATVTSDFSGFITPEMSAPIFEKARRFSAVQQLAKQVPLGASGVKIPVTTGKPTVGWVGEAGKKPASSGSKTLKTITPQKAAAIVVVSAEVVRANPGGYVTDIKDDLAEAFGTAFDKAALHDQGPDGTAGAGPFATFIDQTTKSVELGTTTQANGGIHGDINAGLQLLVAAGKKLNGFALDDQFEPRFWGAVDTSGRPLYVDLPYDASAGAVARPGRLLNRPSFMSDGIYSGTAADVFGYGGDWSQSVWGVVGGISYRVSTEATVTINGVLTSLFENNLVAILAEAEYGFLCNDPESYVKYVDAV
jgi:HK97 family phage major capsid protein